MENQLYLTEQIITYLGNKRSLLSFIRTGLFRVLKDCGKDKISICDMFSGSGIVSRFFKQYATKLYVNDLENYSKTINKCYLYNKQDVDFSLLTKYLHYIEIYIKLYGLHKGIISKLYAPKDDTNIKEGERVYYTCRNAMYIDTVRSLIDNFPKPYKYFFLAPLLYEASVHTNTSGVFKGFYKNKKGIGQFGGEGQNALTRIKGDISLKLPVFSNYECKVKVYQDKANILAKELPYVDLVYLDPPYNQHPYGSNYFMLNLINDYKKPESTSKISGIPDNWNRSPFNNRDTAYKSLKNLCNNFDCKYIMMSYNNEGIISFDEIRDILHKNFKVQVLEKDYSAYKGSRNFRNRASKVKEILFLGKRRK